MRIALISDLHGNEIALKAVLADITRVGADQIICLGDVACLGPRPNAVIQMLSDLGCSCVLGNHDDFLLDPEAIRAYTLAPMIVGAVNACREQISEEELAFLGSFQPGTKMTLAARTTLQLFHGSPGSYMDVLLSTTPDDELDKMLGRSTATVLAGGHSHLQMLRQHRGMLLVNPGSVGLPFKQHVKLQPPTILHHAEYATVAADRGVVDVTMHRVPLSKKKLREAAEAWDSPMGKWLVSQYS